MSIFYLLGKDSLTFMTSGGDGEKDFEEEESQSKQNREQDTARLNAFMEKAGQVKAISIEL